MPSLLLSQYALTQGGEPVGVPLQTPVGLQGRQVVVILIVPSTSLLSLAVATPVVAAVVPRSEARANKKLVPAVENSNMNFLELMERLVDKEYIDFTKGLPPRQRGESAKQMAAHA